jgi:hypothetical protein
MGKRGIKYYLEDLKKLSIGQKLSLVVFIILMLWGASFVFESNVDDPQGKTPFYGIEFSKDF